MGSHRARHRADQNTSEELATDLLARLADEVRAPSSPRTRRAAERPSLDPFSTAPFPARTPRAPEDTADPGVAGPDPAGPNPAGPNPTGPNPAGAPTMPPGSAAVPQQRGGATRRTAGGPEAARASDSGPTAPEAPDQRALSLRSGPAAELSAGYGYAPESGAHVPAPRFPSDPTAPFPLEDTPAGLMDAPRSGRERLAALGRKPIYAAVSATMITAAVAATTGPADVTPPQPSPDRSPSLAAAALDLAPPAPQPGAAAAVPVPGGPAVLTPNTPATSDAAPVLGSTIAAQAAADAKAYAQAQARQAAGRPATAPRNAPAPKPAPKPAVKQAPKPAAAPATGSSVGAHALALAKGKLGAPYVWGAAGPSAFDCSGLIVWAYKQLGVSLPHSSATLSTMGTPVSKAALQPGDLVFFYSPVSHVGIYAGNGMVLNATQSGEPVQFSKLANLPFHNAVRLAK